MSCLEEKRVAQGGMAHLQFLQPAAGCQHRLRQLRDEERVPVEECRDRVPFLPEAARFPAAFVLLGLTGVFGGLFMIPVEAFIQVRAPAEKKGTVLASVAFAIFTAILLAGGLEMALIELLTYAHRALAAVGVMALVMAAWLALTLRSAARWKPGS